MAEKPSLVNGCCLPKVDGVTHLQIGPRRVTIGMEGLEKVFERLDRMERRPEDASDDELVAMARNFNYIPDRPGVQAEFGRFAPSQRTLRKTSGGQNFVTLLQEV